MQRPQTVLRSAKLISQYAAHLLFIRGKSMLQAKQCQVAVSGDGPKCKIFLVPLRLCIHSRFGCALPYFFTAQVQSLQAVQG